MYKRDERGVAAVEFSLIVGMLILLLFGIFEVGLAWKSKHTINDAANSGARAASVGSSFESADYAVLQAVDKALNRVDVDIDYVVVYEAASPEALPTNFCMNGNPNPGNPHRCNVYYPEDFARDVTEFGCKTFSRDKFFCPTDRDSRVGSLDLVGVYVKGTAQSFTGIQEYEFTSHVVLPIEPTSDD